MLMDLEYSRQIFEKDSNIKFHENPSSGSRVVPCGQTDIMKLTVAFRNFANASKYAYATFQYNCFRFQIRFFFGV